MKTCVTSHLIVFILLDVSRGATDKKCLFAEWNIVKSSIGETPPVLTSTGHCVSEDGAAWMFGGIQYSKVNHHIEISDQLWSYDTNTHEWKIHRKRQGSEIWPLPRHSCKLCCGMDHLVLYGGTMSDAVTLQDIWIFDRRNGIWSSINLSTSSNTDHIRVLNSASVTSWCWNETLWYLRDQQGQFQIHHFSLVKMQWLSDDNLLVFNKTTNFRLGESNPVVLKPFIWFFPSIQFISGTLEKEVQAYSFSMESFHLTLHSFPVESDCPGPLENYTDVINFQNKTVLNNYGNSSVFYENATVILGRRNYLSQVWSFDIGAKKLLLSNSCNNILEYGTPVYPCILENSSRWFYNNFWYSHGGVLLCKNDKFYLDQLWSVKLSMMTVCDDTDTVSPGVVFVLIFFSLSAVAIIVLCSIVLKKCVNGPYLKPPVHYGKAIRYSQLALEEIT